MADPAQCETLDVGVGGDGARGDELKPSSSLELFVFLSHGAMILE